MRSHPQTSPLPLRPPLTSPAPHRPRADYRDCARELQRADLQPLSAPARRCLFLNLYNALTVHAVAAAAAERPLASVAEVPGFWRRFAYDVGGEVFSLDDIEHGVLRGALLFFFLDRSFVRLSPPGS